MLRRERGAKDAEQAVQRINGRTVEEGYLRGAAQIAEDIPLAPRLATLVHERGWKDLRGYDAIGAIYDFVQNDIRFGYNASDDLPASAIE
jgi:hypothetical protein